LRWSLANHSVTAYELGWATLKNGVLPQSAELAGYELFITTDKNLIYQQNLHGRKIAIVKTHVTRILEAMNAVVPGGYQGPTSKRIDSLALVSSARIV